MHNCVLTTTISPTYSYTQYVTHAHCTKPRITLATNLFSFSIMTKDQREERSLLLRSTGITYVHNVRTRTRNSLRSFTHICRYRHNMLNKCLEHPPLLQFWWIWIHSTRFCEMKESGRKKEYHSTPWTEILRVKIDDCLRLGHSWGLFFITTLSELVHTVQ